MKVTYIVVALLLSVIAAPCAAGPYMIVNGHFLSNAVRFELDSGNASLFAQYPSASKPRSLAMNSAGTIFATLEAGAQNVVKLVPHPVTGVPHSTTDFTAGIGGFGPGQLEFYNGDLYVAGNASRVIFRYNGTSGALVNQFSSTTSFNILGLAITGDTLYYEEVFQARVREFDLTQNPPTGTTLFTDLTTRLDKTLNMTVGPGGMLVFANERNTFIQQYSNTGAYLGVLADVKTFNIDLTGAWDVEYVPALENYFISAGHQVFRLDTSGNLLQTYESSLLGQATGLLIVVPEPSAAFLFLLGIATLALVTRRSAIRQMA